MQNQCSKVAEVEIETNRVVERPIQQVGEDFKKSWISPGILHLLLIRPTSQLVGLYAMLHQIAQELIISRSLMEGTRKADVLELKNLPIIVCILYI